MIGMTSIAGWPQAGIAVFLMVFAYCIAREAMRQGYDVNLKFPFVSFNLERKTKPPRPKRDKE